MTVSQAPFFHWNSRSDAGRPPFNTCSPALSSLYVYLNHNHGARTLGCFASRPVIGGETASTHSWGAAIDVAFPSDGTTDAVEAWLIAYSQELGINAIIDERNARALPGGNHEFRIWYPLVGWHTFVANASGYNGIHIEITPLAWGDGRPVEVKVNAPPPPPPCRPPYSPETHDYGLYPFNQSKPALGPGFGYTNGTQQFQGFCEYANWVMRIEAGQTILPCEEKVWTIHSMAACQNMQRFFSLPISGWMTVETWGVIDGLATNFGRPR